LSGAATPAQAASDGEIWSAEYWTKKGDIPLYIFRKRLGAPKAGEAPRPVLFLVHGSSVTWRIFDLDTPGHGEYSMMNVFARWASMSGPWITRIMANPAAPAAIPTSRAAR